MDPCQEIHATPATLQTCCDDDCANREFGELVKEANALPEDPKPQEPKSLSFNGCEKQRCDIFTFDIVEKIFERLRLATERQIDNTLRKHHEELLADMRRVMNIDQRHEGSSEGQIKREVHAETHQVSHGSFVESGNSSGPTKKVRLTTTPTVSEMVVDFSGSREVTPRASKISRAATSETLLQTTKAGIKAILHSQMSLDDRVPRLANGEVENVEGACKKRLQRFLNHPIFELAMGFAVSSNSIFIGWEIEYMTAHPGTIIAPWEFAVVSYIYTILFIIELLLRLVADWWGFIWDSDLNCLAWNYLDIIIVGSSLVEVVLDIITIQENGSNDLGLSNLRVIRMVRVFRLIRLLRVARFVRFVRALRMLVFSITCTLKSVFWALVLMAVLIYVFAILFTQATVSHNTIESLNPTIPNLERYWGTIGSSMFSLFMSISGGISWIEVIEPLSEINLSWQIIFLVYIYFTYFAILNVVTGIFCQGALESCSEDHDSMMQTVLRHKRMYTERFMEIFQEIDDDKSGRITEQEFRDRMEDEDVKDYFSSLELHCADALCLFDLFDDAGKKGIEVTEFVMGCLRLKGTARSSDMIRLLHEHRLLLSYMSSILSHFKIDTIGENTMRADVFGDLKKSATAVSISMT